MLHVPSSTEASNVSSPRTLAGGVILGVALWLRHDNQTSSLLMQQFEGQQAPNTFYTSK
uniref:Uncharacterized protein n=1 Tax=Hucho hucho TaxID=62062 RepID=A0A4W5R7T3_9TELE